MNARHRSIQILGWLSIIAGYGLALLLIRGIFIGIKGGFGAERWQAFWIVLVYLLFFAIAVYLFSVGRRALSIAKGRPRPRARFGWGRILLGAIYLYGAGVVHFHLIPVRSVKVLDPTNETQALSVIAVGSILLIFSGVWRAFRPHRTSSPSIEPPTVK